MAFAVLAGFVCAGLAPLLARLLGYRAGWVLALVPASIFVYFVTFIGGVSHGETFRLAWNWVPTYGVRFSFFLDGLSLVFALLISGIGTFILIYAGGYLKGHPQQGRFFSFLLLFMGSMLGLVLADNIVTLFIFWELTSITSFLLIGFDHAREASRRAALQALVVTGGGGLALLAGMLLMGAATDSAELSRIIAQGNLGDHPWYLAILLLVLGGAFTKSAQVPFHFWLPNAMEAPTPVSAYLHSATMVKAGVYLLMRLQPALGGTDLWMTILPIFGGATLLTGVFLGVRQTDLKLMLAYTTVASLGLLVMLTGMSELVAIEAAVLYLLAHSLFKGALFMVAGTIDHEAGTRDVTRLGGLRGAMPVTFTAAVLAALSMGGLPPFFGFIAKEVMYKGVAGVDPAHLALTIVAVVANAMMLAIGAAVALKPFIGRPVETPRHAHEGPVMLWLGPLTLAVAGLVAALFAHATGEAFVAPMTRAIVGAPVEIELHLIPEHFDVALGLSILTVAIGIVFYLTIGRLRAGMARLLAAIGWGPDRGFDQAVAGIIRLAEGVVRLTQPGRLKDYMFVTFALTAVALFLPMAASDTWPAWPNTAPGLTLYEWGVILLGIVGLAVIFSARKRLTAIVALGVQGFSVGLIFLLFGAPDLSFTQFMVETLSVVILALVLTRLNVEETDHRPTGRALVDGVLSIACGVGFALLLMTVTQEALDLRLSEYFTAYSTTVAHGRNIVNVILVDFRALDTLGEITVVLAAGLACLVLIGMRRRRVPRAGEVQ